MKKLMSIITMLLVVIGISGCGSSVPTEVTVEPGKMTTLVVGEDIAEGTYTYEVSGSDDKVLSILTTKDSQFYSYYKQQGYLNGEVSFDETNKLNKSLKLEDGEVLFIQPYEDNGTVKIIKEK